MNRTWQIFTRRWRRMATQRKRRRDASHWNRGERDSLLHWSDHADRFLADRKITVHAVFEERCWLVVDTPWQSQHLENGFTRVLHVLLLFATNTYTSEHATRNRGNTANTEKHARTANENDTIQETLATRINDDIMIITVVVRFCSCLLAVQLHGIIRRTARRAHCARRYRCRCRYFYVRPEPQMRCSAVIRSSALRRLPNPKRPLGFGFCFSSGARAAPLPAMPASCSAGTVD